MRLSALTWCDQTSVLLRQICRIHRGLLNLFLFLPAQLRLMPLNVLMHHWLVFLIDWSVFSGFLNVMIQLYTWESSWGNQHGLFLMASTNKNTFLKKKNILNYGVHFGSVNLWINWADQCFPSVKKSVLSRSTDNGLLILVLNLFLLACSSLAQNAYTEWPSLKGSSGCVTILLWRHRNSNNSKYFPIFQADKHLHIYSARRLNLSTRGRCSAVR